MSSFSVLTPSNCFANLIKEFQILLEAQNSPDNTVRNYMTYISDFLSWVNDIKHIDDLDHVFWSDLREYQIFLRESRNLKGNSINQRFCAIKKLYAGILEKQWNNSAIEKVKYDSFHGTVPTSQEMTVLLKSIRSLNDWIMVALMSECGLRASEVVNVTYSDIRRQRSVATRRGRSVSRHALLDRHWRRQSARAFQPRRRRGAYRERTSSAVGEDGRIARTVRRACAE